MRGSFNKENRIERLIGVGTKVILKIIIGVEPIEK